MKTRHRSLFLRLVAGFMIVMFGVWTCLVAVVIYEALDEGVGMEEVAIETLSQQAMLLAQALAGRPDAMRESLARFEQAENERRMSNDGKFARKLYLQAWMDGALVYGAPSLPPAVPEVKGQGRLHQDGMRLLTSSQADPALRIVVRAAVEDPSSVLLQPASVGYYVLPLVISFPFLMLPVWFTVRVGLRPVKHMIDDIEHRHASDLTPLRASSYKELSPLVNAINRLMARLKERLDREQEFLADAAHELKTPLAVIQVNAEALGSARNPLRLREAHEGLSAGVTRAAHAVHQLLAYARSGADRQRKHAEDIDLVELVRDRMALLAPLALQRRIEVELQAPDVCMLPLHRESMVLLVDNLIDNAIKYSPECGRVLVVIQPYSGSVRLLVIDEGPGIPAAARRKVFERFYRIPGQEQGGSGLGLAIVERAAVQNNAAIHLSDAPEGRGLVVAVDFRCTGTG